MRAWAWPIAVVAVAAALLWVLSTRRGPAPSDLPDAPESTHGAAAELLEADARPDEPTAAPPPRPVPVPEEKSNEPDAASVPTPSPAAPPMIPKQVLSTSFEYRDGDRKVKIWRNPRVLLEFREPGKGASASAASPTPPVKGAVLVRTNRLTRIWILPEGSDSQALADELQVTEPGAYSPAFHAAPSSTAHMQGLPGGVIVQFPEDWDGERIAVWAEEHELGAVAKMTVVPNWFTFQTAPGLESLEVANRLYATGDVVVASPNWWRDQRPR